MSDERRQRFAVPKVLFWGEQDGPPERELKKHVANLFKDHGAVKTAYLANVTFGEESVMNVALCVRAESAGQEDLARKIADIFASLFGRQEYLDIIFLSVEQEAAVARVCSAFFACSGGTPE